VTGRLATIPVDTFTLTSAAGFAPGEARSAALWLAGRARDAGELTGWLEMLGLVRVDTPRRPMPGTTGPVAVPYERPGH
jgi:hypothetical protein